MFYNTENYFDIEDDPEVKDEEFTPEGYKKWTFSKYKEKQLKLSKVILAAGEWRVPELIALAEVENKEVLKDLLKWTPLSRYKFGIIHKESPDFRGIDVALLYRKRFFTPLSQRFIRIRFPFAPAKTTRDILYVKGMVRGKDTLHLFVNHWPSRAGGQKATEPKRLYTAKILGKWADSILNRANAANIVITGDFNDEPFNKSISGVLEAQKDTAQYRSPGLINLMAIQKEKKDLGTYKYRFEWNMLDQFIVSSALLEKKNKLYLHAADAHIMRKEWLLKDDAKYPGKEPHRTFTGPRYRGGFSDHLPMYLDLRIK